MWTIIFFIAIIYLLVQAFNFNLFVGIGAVLAVLAYGYFKWYTEFCIKRAKAVYGKDPEKALRWFHRGDKHGMNIGQKEIYAFYLLREGHVEKAEQIYKQILAERLRPELNLKVRSEYAVLLMKTGRIDEAIEELEEVTLNYVNTTTYGTLGYLYLLKNNRRKAESFNKEAYEYNKDNAIILDNMVQLYIKQENYNEAKKYADELLVKKPYFIEAYYDAAYVYMKLGDFEKALEIAEQGKMCRISFMSTITEEEYALFLQNVSEQNASVPHKLNTFTNLYETKEETEKPLYYADDEEEEPVISYETLPDYEEDENDPFI